MNCFESVWPDPVRRPREAHGRSLIRFRSMKSRTNPTWAVRAALLFLICWSPCHLARAQGLNNLWMGGTNSEEPMPFGGTDLNFISGVANDFPEDHIYNREYQGLWVDGGMLLNFPLHAFDVYAKLTLTPGDTESYQVAIPPAPGQVTEFNTKVLGFRLVDTQEREFNVADVYKEDAGVFGKYAGDLLDTLMYGGAEGQIRTGDERDATIGLNVAGLSTLDCAGPEIDRLREDEGKARLKERLISEAYEWTRYKLQQ